ncbi:MAG: HlyD family efflux transporter periplasmic adaptor subunit [Verrucomicrobiota bacterium]
MKSAFTTIVCVAIALVLGGCQPKPTGAFQGYIEGEYVYVAAPLPGALASLKVKRGEEVQKDQLLFELEREAESAAVREAEKRLAQARARKDNLLKGRRPSEIAAIEARLAQAKVAVELAETELVRRERVHKSGAGAISQEQLEQARAQRDANQAQLDAIYAELETARLGARDDEIRAADAEIEALTAALDKARWALDQKAQKSPAAARVHDTIYQTGEWVAAGSPIVSMLPPENLKVRFFVPQAELPNIKTGQQVSVSFDGASVPVSATINYISTQAEFTPPVIYSQENRSKLVFMIEAAFAPSDAAKLRPGQPVDVRKNLAER